MATELPVGTVTFVFTDIEGSTRLLTALGDAYPDVLARHAALIREVLSTRGGVEVSTEGDSFFAVFGSAGQAVASAAEIQRRLAAESWPEGHEVRVRIGLHTGDGRLGGDNYVGIDVHRAARVASAAHGGQVLLSATTRSLVENDLPTGVTLREIGSHRLKDFERPELLTQLAIDGLQNEFPSPRSVGSIGNLPAQLTSFVGRSREVDQATALVRGGRLVTLTGPGGTGKTRLAGQVGDALKAAFADGVFFVDLASVTDPALVATTIAGTVGLAEQADRPVLDALTAHFEAKALLLILDNFEHLLEATEIVSRLLAAAPRLKVLATSRRVLQLYGEQEFQVPPLAVPDVHSGDDEAVRASEAVALFIDRAGAVRPGFAPSSANLQAIAEICVRLDGLPLAIELAASRIRMLEPAELLARLDRSLTVLSTSATNVPARQRTVRDTIAWSYDLLDRLQQQLFARLSVFVGGWDLGAAEAICNPAAELDLDTMDGVDALMGESLIGRSSESGMSRYRLLEPIREFGLDRLEADGLRDTMARRHLAYYRGLAEVAEPHFVGADQADWAERFERERDNIRAALGRAIELGEIDDGLRLASATWRFWQKRGYLREGRAFLEALLRAGPDRADATRARAYTALGGLTYWLADSAATNDAYEHAVRLWHAIGDRNAEAEAIYNLAYVPVMREDDDEARHRFEASAAAAEAVGRRDLLALSRRTLGTILSLHGESERGLQLTRDALAFFREHNNGTQIAWSLGELGVAQRALGHLGDARAAFGEALLLHTEAGDLPGVGGALNALASVESLEGHHVEAVRLSAAGAQILTTTGTTPPSLFLRYEDVEAAARNSIGDEAVDAALAEGRRLSLPDAVAMATDIATGAGVGS